MLDWTNAPRPDSSNWHQKFEGREWKHDDEGVYLRVQPATVLRTPGAPKTCKAIIDLYGQEILEASVAFKVPPELIVMTIATEVGIHRATNFTGPSTFRWEPGVADYSAGPMQLLSATARGVLEQSKLRKEFKGIDIPQYANAPAAAPSVHPLYEGRLSIWLGAAYIAANAVAYGTGYDPILVAACYNRGRLIQSAANPWRLSVTGDHLDRAAARYGDACAVLASLRAHQPGAAVVATDEDDSHVELYSLTSEQADEEEEYYLDSGADVDRFPQTDGLIALIIDYPPAPAAPPAPALLVGEPTKGGFSLCIDRKLTETRAGKAFARTVGHYQAFFDGVAIPGLSGFAIERQGHGDNSKQGDVHDRRIAADVYRLATHSGKSNKYKTYGYDGVGGIGRRPWPALLVAGTNKRQGILIHPAEGYLMSVGCINLAGGHADARTNIDFRESRARVIALIEAMKSRIGAQFPPGNGSEIPNAWLEIRGEP